MIKFEQFEFLDSPKKYRLFNPPIGTPREIEINGKPLLWGMIGPLPDNVIDLY